MTAVGQNARGSGDTHRPDEAESRDGRMTSRGTRRGFGRGLWDGDAGTLGTLPLELTLRRCQSVANIKAVRGASDIPASVDVVRGTQGGVDVQLDAVGGKRGSGGRGRLAALSGRGLRGGGLAGGSGQGLVVLDGWSWRGRAGRRGRLGRLLAVAGGHGGCGG